MHCAVAKIPASRQEQTTTLYFISVSQGGRAKLSSSIPEAYVSMITSCASDVMYVQQYWKILLGTSANVLLRSFKRSISVGLRLLRSRNTRVSVAGFEGAQRSMQASGCIRRIWSTVSTTVLVFPVPAGPLMRYGTGDWCRAIEETADC